MSVNRKYRQIVVIVAVMTLGIPLMIHWGNQTAKEYVEIQESAVFLSKLAEAIEFGMKYDELAHWQRERWEIDTFFHRPESIEACRIISSKNTNDLKVWIDSGGDVNLTGDHGLTLLYWAMLDRNLPAFKTLLEAGADVDATLTNNIQRTNRRPFYSGDTVYFSALECLEFKFSVCSLRYAKDVNRTSRSGNNLLHRAMNFNLRYSLSVDFLTEIIAAGIDPNVPSSATGSFPATTMISADRPLHCLCILEAGANPSLVDADGDTVASIVEMNFQTKNEIIFTPEHQELVDYLIEHQLLDPAFAVLPATAPAEPVNATDVSHSDSSLAL